MNIQLFWNDVINKNKETLTSYFYDNARILWPCTNEEFTLEEYLIANCDYPGEWTGTIEKLEEEEDEIILVGNVLSKDKTISCHVVSFIYLKNDKIVKLVEYWADDGDVPNWRKEKHIGKSIK